MLALSRLATAVNALNGAIGEAVSWLSLAIVLVCFAVVVQRYALGATQVWMQDLYVWLNGAMFTAVAGFALLREDHVRVDIFYRPASVRAKAAIDLLGVVAFLWPFAAVVALYGHTFVLRSWGLAEGSPNVGGMPGLFVLKSFILVFAGLVALQGASMAARSLLVLAGRDDLVDPRNAYGKE